MKSLFWLLIINYLSLYIFSSDPIPLRGIVEGFYGTPWSFEDRADLIKFSGKHKLNAYIYAPKDDPYHREKWREPYPEDKIKDLKNLISIGEQNKVRFIFAVSPGLDLNYYEEKGEEDFNTLMAKLDSLYEIGCRDFAIFFDDINAGNDDGANQAKFLNKLQEELDKKYEEINPLITVPTEYWRTSMIDKDGNVKKYTKDFVNLLNEKIIVLYTGDGVVCDGISEESYKKATDIYKRNLGLWWNYPVNDFLNTKLALGPIEKLPTSNINSIFFNPMGEVQLSKIALETGAEYSLSPETYDSEESWNRVLENQFGELAPAMKVFASHSRHMENDWANVGPADSPEFYELGHEAILNLRNKKSLNVSSLLTLIDEMDESADILLAKLPPEILSECKKHLEQFKRIINADRVAAKSLENAKLDPELKSLRKEISKYESQAILSEKSAIKFIDEVIDVFGKIN